MNDKKEKRLMTIVASVIVGLIALILIVMFCILRSVQNYIGQNYVSNHEYVKTSEIKTYVEENRDELTLIAQRLIDDQQESHKLYDELSEIKEILESDIYDYFDIDTLEVLKSFGENKRDSFSIYLKSPPEDEEYDRCGIYYSPSNTIIDPYGNYQSGDTYTYDGRPDHDRCMYKSERICDCWFYFETAVW